MKKKKTSRILGLVAAIIAAVFIGFYVYTMDYYKALPVVEDTLYTKEN